MVDLKLQQFAETTMKLISELTRFFRISVRQIVGGCNKSVLNWFACFRDPEASYFKAVFPIVFGAMMPSAESVALRTSSFASLFAVLVNVGITVSFSESKSEINPRDKHAT